MNEMSTQVPLPGTPPVESPLLCPECGQEGVTTLFETPQGLSAHRRRVHNVTPEQVVVPANSKPEQVTLTCPECEANGVKRFFTSPQGLAHHRSATHKVEPSEHAKKVKQKREEKKGAAVGPFPCPECKAAGIDRAFAEAKGLGAHRRAKHGVIGKSETATRERKQKAAAAGAVTKQQRPIPVVDKPGPIGRAKVVQARRNLGSSSASLVAPNGLSSEREFAAYRFGVLQMMLHAIETGVIDAPAPMFLGMFQAELDDRKATLEGSV